MSAKETPKDQLRLSALVHYDRVSGLAHEWTNVIPLAIDYFYIAGPQVEEDLAVSERKTEFWKEEAKRLRAALRKAISEADGWHDECHGGKCPDLDPERIMSVGGAI